MRKRRNPVQQADGALDDLAVDAQLGSVRSSVSGDDLFDALGPDQAPVLVVVVAAVGQQPPGSSPRPADPAPDRWHRLQQRHQLSDVVAVPAGQRQGERGAVAVGQQVVFGAWPAAVDRARPGFGSPFNARTWELSIIALDQSSCPAACSSSSRSRCSRSHTPA